ncbi:hypothetical protein [Ottowia thiooxydans]|uniref:hypothetical protein n=1 Tax=Ottowia thiooxydans TaxID=219182 RepID=UPI0012EBCE1D|nr:hypothetical protein [Ottowia thiooxydans]
MSAINLARQDAPITPAKAAGTPTPNLQSDLAAFNASNGASSYIERVNFAAIHPGESRMSPISISLMTPFSPGC